jgi:cadmium resistance protein CadD (predicted permease)
MGKIIIGAVLIFLQIISYVGSLAAGGVKFFSAFSIYEVAYFIGYNLVGFIGLIVLFLGIRSLKKQKTNIEDDDD